MLEPIEGATDFIVYILVAWSELITEQMEDGKIDLVSAVRIGGMNFRLDVGGIVEQNIKYIVTLMLVCANDFRIDRDMIGYQSIGDNSFLKPEVFGRIARIDSVNPGLKLLSVAAGMKCLTNIIISKYG